MTAIPYGRIQLSAHLDAEVFQSLNDLSDRTRYTKRSLIEEAIRDLVRKYEEPAAKAA